MEEGLVLGGAPVSSVHGRLISDVKGSRDNLAVAFGQHQTNMARQPSMKLVEKLLREILAAIIESIDVAFVKTKHGAHMFFCQFFALHRSDCDSPLRNLASFALDLVAPIAAEAAEIIIKGGEIVILPVELDPAPGDESYLFESGDFIVQAEIDVN